MSLLKKSHSLLAFIIVASGLAGCQSPPIQSSQQPPAIETSAITTPAIIEDIEVKDYRVTQWANGYDWQLQQVVDAQGNAINVATVPPITIEVAPSNIKLTQGCQHYDIEFLSILAPPFPNYGSGKLAAESLCADNLIDETIKSETISNSYNDNYNTIEKLFPQYPYSSLNFNLNLLPLDKALLQSKISTNVAPKRLALNIENGASLIFTGTSKNWLKPTGLPITNELLKRYQWRLASGTSNNYENNGKLISRAPISDFYYPDITILLSFSADRNQYASFYADCNQGIGGPYALLKDHTLLIGYGLQTVMGCGFQGNRLETTLSGLMARSKSKLTLSLQPTKLTSTTSVDFPQYNLVQTMQTGETLVWQNETLPKPKYLTQESDEEASEAEPKIK